MRTLAKTSFEARTTVSGRLNLLVVDATLNVKKFEHDCTRRICAVLRHAGVTLTSKSPYVATDFASFASAFETEEPWNALLIFSHGRRHTGTVDYLRLADVKGNWYLANGVDMRLQDKAVFLCVCEGACEDAIYVLLRDQLALILTAPTAKLSAAEAEAFFPRVLEALNIKDELVPEDVRDVVEKHGEAASHKMVVLSAVGLL